VCIDIVGLIECETRALSNNEPLAKNGKRTKLRKKTNLRGLLTLTSLLIAAALNACMSFSLPTLLLLSALPTAFAQMAGDHDGINSLFSSSSSSSSLLASASTSAPDEFRIVFSKLGVSSGNYQRIMYDSETNSLRLYNISTAINKDGSGQLFLHQGQSQYQSNKQVSDFDKKNLKQMVDQDGFFQANGIYAPPGAGANDSYDTVYVLSMDIDNKTHNVIWTDTSENVPTAVLSIAKTIEKLTSS
jgi:hypothetical protein